jgi:hypothetical protein
MLKQRNGPLEVDTTLVFCTLLVTKIGLKSGFRTIEVHSFLSSCCKNPIQLFEGYAWASWQQYAKEFGATFANVLR